MLGLLYHHATLLVLILIVTFSAHIFMNAILKNMKKMNGDRKPSSTAGFIYEEYHDKGCKGAYKRGTRYIRYVAELTVAGKRFRHRSMDRDKVEEWLKAVRSGRIKPTQKGADWMNVEQRKDLELRNYELIVSAAEEAVLVMNFFDTRDIQPITQYMYDRLLPHMVYYCCNTLRLPKDLSLNYTKQAAALIYTMLYDGKPITNMTKTAKRMLRVRKEHRDFFYYERTPNVAKVAISKIDIEKLGEVWKVTRDKRI